MAANQRSLGTPAQEAAWRAKAVAVEGERLSDLRPEVARLAIRNLSRPDVAPVDLSVRSNQSVEWRCQCGKSFPLAVSNATKARVLLCRTCQRRGKSRFEFEVASLLEGMLGCVVLNHYGQGMDEVDIYIPALDWSVELDPHSSHSNRLNTDRRRLVHHQKRSPRVFRVREEPLVAIDGCLSVPHRSPLNVWVDAIAQKVAPEGWRQLDDTETQILLERANSEWETVLATPPSPALSDCTDLMPEFLGNLSHPGRRPEWTPVVCGDTCLWKCRTCKHEWKAPIARRTSGLMSGCRPCARKDQARKAAIAPAGGSVADVAPLLVREFVRNITRQDFDLTMSYPGSTDVCEWKCSECKKVWPARIAHRVSKSHIGCHSCNSRRGWQEQRRHDTEGVLAKRWQQAFDALGLFVAREQHAAVPRDHVEGPVALGVWVLTQRRNREKLVTSKVAALEALPGWIWHKGDATWEHGFEMLRLFMLREGHANIHVRHFEQDHRLGQWAAYQRKKFASGQLQEDRRMRLDALPTWAWKQTA